MQKRLLILLLRAVSSEFLPYMQYDAGSRHSKVWDPFKPEELCVCPGLVSDAFHLSFGCCVLLLSLCAMVWGRQRANEDFTYGCVYTCAAMYLCNHALMCAPVYVVVYVSIFTFRVTSVQ